MGKGLVILKITLEDIIAFDTVHLAKWQLIFFVCYADCFYFYYYLFSEYRKHNSHNNGWLRNTCISKITS